MPKVTAHSFSRHHAAVAPATGHSVLISAGIAIAALAFVLGITLGLGGRP